MNHDYFFNTFFTIEGIVNNLVILDIKIIIQKIKMINVFFAQVLMKQEEKDVYFAHMINMEYTNQALAMMKKLDYIMIKKN